MSTRGLYGFKVDGKVKATYCHSDAYPDWLGRNIATFIKSHDLKLIRQFARDIVMKDEHGPYTAEEVTYCKNRDWYNGDVGGPEMSWYQLLRRTHGKLEMLWEAWKNGKPAYMMEYASFVKSPPCAYVYYIDVDEEVLEYRARHGEWHRLPLNTTRSVDAIVDWMEKHSAR